MADKKGKVNMKQAQGKKMTIQSTIKTDLVINFKEADELEKLLSHKLLRVFPNKDKIKIDWVAVRKEKLPKRLRKEKIRTMKETKKLEVMKEENIDADLQKFLIVGFNSVVKQLQADNISSVIVNSKLPSNLQMFLLPLCKSKQVAVVGLEKLDLVTKAAMGFSSTVIGLTLDVKQELNYFNEVSRLIMEVWKQEAKEDIVQNSNIGVEVSAEENVKKGAIDTVIKSKKDQEVGQCKIRNFHLKRKSCSERAFIPDGDTVDINVQENDAVPVKKQKKALQIPYYNSLLM